MTYGEALTQLSKGKVVRRRSWPAHMGLYAYEDGGEVQRRALRRPSDPGVSPTDLFEWFAGQSDLAANDWEVCDFPPPFDAPVDSDLQTC